MPPVEVIDVDEVDNGEDCGERSASANNDKILIDLVSDDGDDTDDEIEVLEERPVDTVEEQRRNRKLNVSTSVSTSAATHARSTISKKRRFPTSSPGNDETKTLRLSRDRQYALYLERKRPIVSLDGGHQTQTGNAIDLVGGSGKGIDKKDNKRCNIPMRPFSTNSSSDDDSKSSEWMKSNEDATNDYPHTITLRGNKNMLSSASDSTNSSDIESQGASDTASKKSRCDFTGKRIPANSNRRTGFRQRKMDRNEDVPPRRQDISVSSFVDHHSMQPNSTQRNLTQRNPSQRKPPPPLTNRKEIEENIFNISQKMHFKKKVADKNVMRKALSQHKARNQQIRSTRTVSPRFEATTTKLEYMDHKDSQSISTNGHTTIINSSAMVISTSNDEKKKEEDDRKELHNKAEALSLMPYEYKNIQEKFVEILEALPVDQRYHPEVHEIVCQLLYTPVKNGAKVKCEVPHRFKEAPTNDDSGGTTDAKDHEENEINYESIMKSFRDFCVQCKTFDCQFHITKYPDAGTQACVSFQYDKRALQRESREKVQLNPRDPFSFLVPVTGKRFHLVDEEKILDCFKKSLSTDERKSSEPWTLCIEESTTASDCHDNTTCRFCKFSCCHQETLSKHLSRYHQDTFYCREIGSKFKPAREYFHSRSLIPIENGHFDRDSDDESNYSWYQEFRRDAMKDLTDVTEEEKSIQNMWNRFVGCSPIVLADRDLPKRCFYFVQKFYAELQQLEWELYQLFITFWERHLLTVIHVEKLIHLYHFKCNTNDSNKRHSDKNEDTVLSPRNRLIFSRLHLIFQSFGEDAISRLCSSMRRDVSISKNIESTPMLPKHLWPKWRKNRTINVPMRMRAGDISRPFFYPCSHAGKCSLQNGCTCLENGYVCTKHCIWGEFGENFFPGCNCIGDCSIARQCPCRDANRECDPDICRCFASTDDCRKSCGCSNMDVSLAKRAPLIIGRSQISGAGLGLFTKSDLKKGDYIDEYIGELIKEQHHEGRSEEYYFDHSDDYIADATHQGNKTRYLNHSPTPNIEARHRFVNGEKRIAFYAKQDIPAQTELFYSYGKSYNKIWRLKGLPHLCVDSDDDGYAEKDDDSE